MEFQKVERVFNLPDNADADIVAETVRAIISTSVSTEKLILTTDPPEIHASVYMNIAPEAEDDAESVGPWDVLHKVALHTPEADGEEAHEKEALILRFVYAAQHLAENNRVAMGIACHSIDYFWECIDLPRAVRFLNLPIIEVPRLDVGKAIVLGGASNVSGLIFATHGVLVEWEE